MPKKSKKQKKRKSSSTHFSAPSVGPAFQKLVAVMSRLRSPGGCPWDREQTHATLRTYLIEEAYEVLDALDSTDDAKFAEELGDLLLQVLFHAQIAHEEKRFDISDVVREIHDKMVRRHPHVFGDTSAKTAAEVLRNWETIKKTERSSKSVSAPEVRAESVLDGVPRSIPALLEANQLTRKAARIGFDWRDLDGIFAKLTEETGELQAVLEQARQAGANLTESGETKSRPSPQDQFLASRIEGEVGDILFVAVNLARFLNIDPEIALKKTSAKFSRRFRTMERIAAGQGTTLARLPRPQMESLWDLAKSRESQAPL